MENKDLELKDGTTKIFLNSKGTIGEADEDIVDFLEYLNGGVPKGGLTKSIDKEVTVVKLRKELEAEFMTYRSGFMDARVIGRAEGKAEEKSFFAEMMLRANEPVSKIRQYTQLSLEQIQEIAKSIGVAVVM